jgi:hypothetical protein
VLEQCLVGRPVPQPEVEEPGADGGAHRAALVGRPRDGDGEEVVTDGQLRLTPGAQVSIAGPRGSGPGEGGEGARGGTGTGGGRDGAGRSGNGRRGRNSQ